MAAHPEDLPISEKASAHAARRAAINTLAQTAYRAYRETGRVAVFGELLLALYPDTCRTLHNAYGIRNPEDREDVFQYVVVRFLKFATSYDEQRPFPAWWSRIVRNAAMDFFSYSVKRLKHEDSSGDDALADTSPDVSKRARQSETALILDDALGRLDEYDRRILWLHYAEGFTAEEMADSLDESLDKTKSHIRRALRNLRKVLKPDVAPRGKAKGEGMEARHD